MGDGTGGSTEFIYAATLTVLWLCLCMDRVGSARHNTLDLRLCVRAEAVTTHSNRVEHFPFREHPAEAVLAVV